ncbi:MAG: acyl-CoA/acyl-ACP dehydrogenase [Porticoccaceae bacterium]|nr:acyl-CoA/acyl-ACP dehydrogenase [Porticoccaceae bacterium]|tara:strand:- start:3167 stop:4300 length:1134 start_codon:yes stop_codon:yes gene_type:complete
MIKRTANLEISFSDEQAMILDSAKDFCRDKSDITTVRSLLKSETGYKNDVWAEMIALGWTGLALPEQYGGSGMGVGATIPLVESMGRHLLCTPFITSTIASQAILRGGTEDQKSRWLPSIVEGAIAAMAMLDNEDWGATEIRCTLTPKDGGFVLEGKKLQVNDAAKADLFLVLASSNGAPTLVLVEATALPQGAISNNTLVDETKRASNVDFSGVTVKADAILAKGFEALHDVRLIGALLTATEATGTAAAALDTLVGYLTTRKQFGRLIGSYQALKHPTVDILLQMDSARTLIYHAATLINDASLNKDTEIACRMAKAQATDALLFAGDRSVQFHGGMGFTYDCDAMLYIRRAQWAQHQYGDAQHHRKLLAPLLLD